MMTPDPSSGFVIRIKINQLETLVKRKDDTFASTYTNMPDQLTAQNNRNRVRGKTPPRGLGGSALGRYVVFPMSVGGPY